MGSFLQSRKKLIWAFKLMRTEMFWYVQAHCSSSGGGKRRGELGTRDSSLQHAWRGEEHSHSSYSNPDILETSLLPLLSVGNTHGLTDVSLRNQVRIKLLCIQHRTFKSVKGNQQLTVTKWLYCSWNKTQTSAGLHHTSKEFPGSQDFPDKWVSRNRNRRKAHTIFKLLQDTSKAVYSKVSPLRWISCLDRAIYHIGLSQNSIVTKRCEVLRILHGRTEITV